jgi:predicted ATPase/transcriptional regulator with XRE-family HTH domain
MASEAQASAFGELLRRYRLVTGLSQEALAERAGLSTVAISDLERGLTRRPYPATIASLAEALALAAADREALVTAARRPTHASSRDATTPAAPTPRVTPDPLAPSTLLAPRTALLGRTREITTLQDLLRTAAQDGGPHVLTLTGPGGVGKTRLAVQVAAGVRDAFPDGVVIVPLAAITDPALVLPAIWQALAVSGSSGQLLRESLQAYLRHKRMLLLLDNCEQVAEAAPEVAALLAACAGLHVLATSRAPLRLRGERIFRVEPLAVPGTAPLPPLETLAQCEAVHLFLARAQEVEPAFTLTPDNAAAVAQICVRLDGLPLALELAATRLRLLEPSTLLARLSKRLPLLTGGARDLPARHQTMRATIAWSYDLLRPAEQSLFRRLAVFAGGWTLEAAEAVGADGAGEVLDWLDALLTQSLLRREPQPGGESRYTMLETIREYALERLEESGAAAQVRQAHATYFLALAEEAEPALHGPEQARWQQRLEQEHDNIRAVLAWVLAHGAGTVPPVPAQEMRAMVEPLVLGLRLAGALERFWTWRGHATEGQRWLDALLAGSGTVPPRVRARACTTLGTLAWASGDHATAAAHHARALALYRALDDRRGMARALHNLGAVTAIQGDYAWATSLGEESLALYRSLRDGPGIALALNNLAAIALGHPDYARAGSLLEESLALSRQQGDTLGTAIALSNLADAARGQGDYARAVALYEQSLTLHESIGDRMGRRQDLVELAGALQALGQHDRALALYRESLSEYQAGGNPRSAAYALEGIALIHAVQGQPEPAARLVGAAAALRAAIGAPLMEPDRRRYDPALAAVRTVLGEEAFAAAWAAGQTLSLEQAITEALQATA